MADMLKNKCILRRIVLVVMIVALLCGAVYTVASANNDTKMKTGAVDIELNQFHKQNGKESAWSGKASVMPGEKVSLIPRVHNKGMDCYIRVKLTFRETDKVNESHLTGIGKNWTKADDGFWYYKKPIKQNGTVDVFTGLAIPKNLPKSMENQKFYLDIDVHAIQARNFDPDYDMASPWGSVEIIEHTKDGANDYTSYQDYEGKAFEIITQGHAEDLFTDVDNFFAKIPHLMPGDTYSEDLTYKNKTNKDIELYFRSLIQNAGELPSKIDLKITRVVDGKTLLIYEGKLDADKFNKDSLLALIPAGEEGYFTFEIHIPATMNNAFNMEDSHIKWVFSTKSLDGDGVNTGDHTNIEIYIILAGTALAALAILMIINKRRKNDEEGKKDE